MDGLDDYSCASLREWEFSFSLLELESLEIDMCLDYIRTTPLMTVLTYAEVFILYTGVSSSRILSLMANYVC